MSKCVRCGMPAGALYSLCPNCISLPDEERSRPASADPTDESSAPGITGVPEAPTPDPGLYATFPRRLNALSVDSLVLIAFSTPVFFLMPTLAARPSLRAGVVALWWGVLLLYEPLCVWRLGGTAGHRLMNLRVVDDRTGGNIGFGKALARLPIKGVLGILAFFTMALSRRHLAIHDMATGSSVQIRDAARAQPHHYVLARAPTTASRTT